MPTATITLYYQRTIEVEVTADEAADLLDGYDPIGFDEVEDVPGVDYSDHSLEFVDGHPAADWVAGHKERRCVERRGRWVEADDAPVAVWDPEDG